MSTIKDLLVQLKDTQTDKEHVLIKVRQLLEKHIKDKNEWPSLIDSGNKEICYVAKSSRLMLVVRPEPRFKIGNYEVTAAKTNDVVQVLETLDRSIEEIHNKIVDDIENIQENINRIKETNRI